MLYLAKKLQFTPPPSKRQVRSDSREDDKNDPSYRGNKGSPPPHSVRSDYFPASQLFEYQWPLGNTTADYFMLQEQVTCVRMYIRRIEGGDVNRRKTVACIIKWFSL